jgi:hypothetical protein
MKKLISLFILGIFLFSFTSALDNLGTFKQNSDVRVSQICFDATYVIIAISTPDSVIAIANQNMTNNGAGEFSYSFNNTSQLGRYDVRGISDGCEKTFATYFEVTPSGSEQNPNFFYLIYIIIFVFLGLGFYLQDNTFLRLSSVMLSLNGLYIILYGFPGIKDSIYTYFVGAILLGLAGYILVKSSYEEIAY